MASTYTTNTGIEKPEIGAQDGTWGNTVNTNFDLIDESTNGVISNTLSIIGTSGSPNNLPITDGTSSNGRNKFIELVDGGDLGGTAFLQFTPNNAEKVVHIRNSLSGSRSVNIFQGTYNASNDYTLANGKDAVLKFDGAGAGAVVSQVFVDLDATAIAGITATNLLDKTAAEAVTGQYTFTAPILGTPASGVATNLTGTAAGLTAGNVTNNANLTGHVTSTGNAAILGAFSISQLNTAISDATLSGNNTGDNVAASSSTAGIAELATAAEIDTGTDTGRVIPVDQFVASNRNIRYLVFSLVASGTDVAVDTSIGGDFTIPFTGTILQSDTDHDQLAATTDTAGTTGTMVVDVHLNGTTIMTTNKLDIETTEKGTQTAATQPDLTTTAITAGDILTFDIDAVHTTAAKGLKVLIAIREGNT